MLPIHPTLSRFALAMLALPATLGLALCLVRPDRVALWAFAMIGMPVLLAATRRLRRFENAIVASSEAAMQERREVFSIAVVWASLVIALVMGAKLADVLGLVDHALADDVATRWANLLAAGFLILQGNRLPKILLPLSNCHDPATMQTARRHAGLAYVLAGLSFAIDWIVLPGQLAQPFGFAILVGGVLTPAVIMQVRMRMCFPRPAR